MNNKQSSQLIFDSLREKLNQLNLNNDEIDNININSFLNSDAGLKNIIEQIINIILFHQRENFLKNNDDYANGFYSRTLDTSVDKLNLNIPRTRNLNKDNKFFPDLITRYKRNDVSYRELVASLLYNNKSKQHIKNVLKEFKLSFSKDVLNELSDELNSKISDFKNTELPQEIPFVFIDAKHVSIKINDKNDAEYGKVKTGAIYTVIGLHFDGSKQVLGYYINFGSENKGSWIKIFNDLINRKLTKVMMFISDDFPGISDAIHSVYHKSYCQKCTVHFTRNVYRNLKNDDAKSFIKQFKNIKNDDSLSFTEAVSKFENLCNSFKSKNETFFNYVLNQKEEYMNFTNFKSDIWKYINNTNIAENFNSLLEVTRRNLGGYFQSLNVAEQSIYLVINKLHNNVWTKVNPIIKNVQYEIEQKFRLTFEE